MSLIFFDFEVFKYDWLVVFNEPEKREETVIVNDADRLKMFYERNKDSLFVGYNVRGYDQFIFKAILCGFNPKDVNDWIIIQHKNGWFFSDLFRDVPLNFYDVMTSEHSLKQLEAFMGNDIEETSVPFDINRKLTPSEIQETIGYCRHDVEQTIEVFLHRYEMFESHQLLIKTFGLPVSSFGKTQAQLVATILGAKKREYGDEFDITIPDTLKLEKYAYVKDWYIGAKDRCKQSMMEKGLDWQDYELFKKEFYSQTLETEIAGVPHVFAWGGVHGAIPKYADDGYFIMSDVASLYPSLMIRYNYFSRSIRDPRKYVEIYNTNLEMKKSKDPRRPAYKLVCNTTYGCYKDKHNPLYDPLMANNICVAGQLLLLDLIEKIEPYFQLVQSNTDGILVKLDDTDEAFDRLDNIVKEWETRTGLVMEFSEYSRVVQGDVNNYIILSPDGKSKGKGAYVKKLNELDNDLPIINRGIREYIINGVLPEKTVNECDELALFQKIVRVSRKYAYAVLNGKRLTDKTFRVFASKRAEDGLIGKVKVEGGTVEKFANTPERCFVMNGDIKGKKVPEYLDKQWYIDLIKTRLKDKFGLVV